MYNFNFDYERCSVIFAKTWPILRNKNELHVHDTNVCNKQMR